jgi:choline dehydrogenase-like flavoprotein
VAPSPEVLVVGSGPVGIAAARCLAEHGLRVTVLEAGLAITDPPGSHLRNQARFQQDPDAFFGAVERHLVPVAAAGDPPCPVPRTRRCSAGRACSGPTTARARPGSSAGTR